MKFTPLSKEEVASMGMIQPGQYSFKVVHAQDELSKSSGQEQIKLTLTVYDASGKDHQLFDYLTGYASAQYKVRHFCEAVGLTDKYESGSLEGNDCLYREGKLEVFMQKGKEKEDGTKYPDRASVKDYLPQEESTSSELKEDADIPF